jgi:hypothetical protein
MSRDLHPDLFGGETPIIIDEQVPLPGEPDQDPDLWEDDHDDDSYCPTCLGEGLVLICCDDICVGQGYCMHGDGGEVCPECGGTG